MNMENGSSFISNPNQEDKSGRPTYASAASRNSSTIDPRSIEVVPDAHSRSFFQPILNLFRIIFRRG